MSNRQPRVVITGMGALTPLGLSVETFWDAMMRGDSGAAGAVRCLAAPNPEKAEGFHHSLISSFP